MTVARRRPLTVWVEDELLGQEVALPADLVVLSTGIEPAAGSESLAQQLRIAQTLDGWFQEAHQKLRPVDSATEGVFLCGVAHYPKSLGETAAQAQAAAIRAAGILFQTELLASEMVARITPEACRRCLACVELCPFGAVALSDAKPEVRLEVCRGCGVCAAECPAGAIHMSRGAEPELAAQIEAALRRRDEDWRRLMVGKIFRSSKLISRLAQVVGGVGRGGFKTRPYRNIEELWWSGRTPTNSSSPLIIKADG